MNEVDHSFVNYWVCLPDRGFNFGDFIQISFDESHDTSKNN
jgi:hypothetical protein